MKDRVVELINQIGNVYLRRSNMKPCNYKLKDITGYFYKYGLIWVGWIVVKREQQPELYYDNNKYMYVWPETNIECLYFGFTKNRVVKKLKNTVNKLVKRLED